MNIKMKLAALSLAAGLALSGCAAGTAATSTTTTSTTTSSTANESTAVGETARQGMRGGGAGNDIEASSVTTEAELVALIQEAYGNGGLGLHRGHEPVQDVLDEVLTISHEELHVRMDSGQNLSDIAEDLGVSTQTLVDALVESWSPAIDTLLASGTITQEQADAYTAALEEAFTYRVTWDGEAATPTFDGLTT